MANETLGVASLVQCPAGVFGQLHGTANLTTLIRVIKGIQEASTAIHRLISVALIIELQSLRGTLAQRDFIFRIVSMGPSQLAEKMASISLAALTAGVRFS